MIKTEYQLRMEREPWRRWYKTAHWARLRTIVLNRDPVCTICDRYPSTVADHTKPHRGIWERFCDLSNLAGVCKPCHDTKTATEDGGFGNTKKVGGSVITTTTIGTDLIDAALADIDKIAALDV